MKAKPRPPAIVGVPRGPSPIEFLYAGASGASHSDERVVFFERREPRDAEEAAAFEQRLSALRLQLEQRRVETELIAEIRAARAQQRELEVRAEEAR